MDLSTLIRERALASGVDPATLLRIAQVESGLNPNATNPASSASGLYQFTRGTWGRYGSGDPRDPVASTDAAARLTNANTSALRSAGLPVTPGTIYLSHFAGADGARKLLTASPDTPAGAVLGEKAVQANPFLGRMTAGQLTNWASSKMGGAGPTAETATPAAAAPVAAAAPAEAESETAQPALAGAMQQLMGGAGGYAQRESPEVKTAQLPAINYPNTPAMQRARALARAAIMRTM